MRLRVILGACVCPAALCEDVANMGEPSTTVYPCFFFMSTKMLFGIDFAKNMYFFAITSRKEWSSQIIINRYPCWSFFSGRHNICAKWEQIIISVFFFLFFFIWSNTKFLVIDICSLEVTHILKACYCLFVSVYWSVLIHQMHFIPFHALFYCFSVALSTKMWCGFPEVLCAGWRIGAFYRLMVTQEKRPSWSTTLQPFMNSNTWPVLVGHCSPSWQKDSH